MARRPTMILRSLPDLRRAMQEAEHDTVSLAAKVGRSRQLIAYLAAGTRTSTSEETAYAIEDNLSVARGSLFSNMSASSDNTGEDMEPHLKPKEAAVLMGVSEKHVRRLIADGELEVTDVARAGSRKSKTRIPSTSLAAYMRRQVQPRPVRTA